MPSPAATIATPPQRERPNCAAAGAEWLRTFGLEYDPSEVMVCAGAKAALHMALQAIVEPGDRVLVLAPHWVSYPALVALADGEPVVVEANPQRGFVHDAASIEKAVQKHAAKGVIVNFPNNPSGAVPGRNDVGALVDIAVRHDLWLLSDEIYATLLYDDAEHISPARLPGGHERTIVVNGFTKSHTLTGWRTSFLAAPADIVSTAARMQSQVLGNPCTISQAAMLAACRTPLPDDQTRRMAAFTERRDYLVEQLNALPGVSLASPRGSFYALIDIRQICERREIDDFAACNQLLETHHLALVPGSAFAAPGFVRASFAVSMQQLEEAVARIRAWVEAE